MRLTGKAKEQFEEWWKTQPKSFVNMGFCYLSYGSKLVRLDSISESMQWGVYQDWADSLGYYITNSFIGGNKPFAPDITKDDNLLWEDYFNTRQEARNAAIEKLNELINEI